MKENENINNETKIEETPANSQEVSQDITPIDVEKVNIYEINTDIDLSNFEEQVEERRSNLQKAYKKARKLSNIMTLCMVLLVVASIVMISQEQDLVKYIGYGVGGVSLVGMLIYYVVNRNKMPDMMKDYMTTVSNLFNAFLYKNDKFKNLSNNPEEKLDMGEIVSDRIYANVKGIGSRDVIRGSFLDKPFLVSDVKAVTVNGKNKEEDLFVGKYISCENGYRFDGRVILNICLKGEKVYDIPTDVADLEEVEHKDQMTIWATPGLDYKKILTKDILNKINNLDVRKDKGLYNVNVVVWGGHTAVYLSYDNSIMSFPFEEEFKKAGLERFKADQNLMFEVFEMMSKTKQIKGGIAKKAPENVEEAPAEAPVAEETKLEEAPTETPAVEEAKVAEITIETKVEAPCEEVKPEEPVVETPAQEVKAEEAKEEKSVDVKKAPAKKAPAKKTTAKKSTTKKTTTKKTTSKTEVK